MGPATQEGIRLRGGTGVLGALRQVGYLQNVSEEHRAPPDRLLLKSRDPCTHNPWHGAWPRVCPQYMLDESLSHRKTSDNTMGGRGKWYFFASSFMEYY